MAEAGARLGRRDFLEGARCHLDWVLSKQDSDTGWFDLCGFSEADHEARRAVTHTIAYTIWGVLLTAELLGRDDGIEAAMRAADGVGRRLDASGWLPGVLDHEWRGLAGWACVTGNCQMALVWQRLAVRTGEDRHSARAGRALALAARSQSLTSRNGGIRGGLPGSDPIWGDYLYAAFPNWAAKFFVDTYLATSDTIAG
jgi:hypothetical protein